MTPFLVKAEKYPYYLIWIMLKPVIAASGNDYVFNKAPILSDNRLTYTSRRR